VTNTTLPATSNKLFIVGNGSPENRPLFLPTRQTALL
jgi:hypothetical protein